MFLPQKNNKLTLHRSYQKSIVCFATVPLLTELGHHITELWKIDWLIFLSHIILLNNWRINLSKMDVSYFSTCCFSSIILPTKSYSLLLGPSHSSRPCTQNKSIKATRIKFIKIMKLMNIHSGVFGKPNTYK